MKKLNRTLDKVIEENKREILSSQIALNNYRKQLDNKTIENGK
jgi:hypothetical protein